MSMQISYLSDRPQAIDTIAKWYFDEWGHLQKDSSIDSFSKDLQEYLNTDKIPLILIAKNGDEILGVVQLKFREMSIYPEKEHWLGGVYVAKVHRGNNIAEQMIAKLVDVAKNLGVERLYLQTESLDGGLYARLGWQALEKVNYRGTDVLVMERELT